MNLKIKAESCKCTEFKYSIRHAMNPNGERKCDDNVKRDSTIVAEPSVHH